MGALRLARVEEKKAGKGRATDGDVAGTEEVRGGEVGVILVWCRARRFGE